MKLLSTPDTIPEAPNTGSNSHKAGNIIGLGNQVKSLLPTPVTDPQSANGHARDLGSEVRLLPTTTAMDSEASGGSTPADMTLTDAVVRTQLGKVGNPRHPSLLPTPRTTDMNGPGIHGDGGIDLRTAVTLLPTPVAQPSGNTPEEHLRKKPGREIVTDLAIIAENGLIESGGRLIPTPRATRGGSSTEISYAMGGERADDERPQGVVVPGADWGPYAAAIERWETVIGRPAPRPVRNDGKNGKPRLNPELTEWMMGWPLGWVTAAVIGLKRAEQLKACGNGVVTLQAAAALRIMLERPGVPHIHYGLAA
ncbi:hypothetical protein [uncultured Microbacterium sp.]|uniref:hypothetical protein n=1 Tax=uncultured Microbacterium sp. TaxID=191216 RepID=UPI0025F391C7|nr:hypothetical protein [uncultured Microbacterium sp.]